MTNTKKVYHQTREMHRAVLRAVRQDDVQGMRQKLNQLYDPYNSPLVQVTEGPCAKALVPVVDGAMLAMAKGSTKCGAELLDNVKAIGPTFGLSDAAIESIGAAAKAAANQDCAAMDKHLGQAGFGDAGMCIPDAMREM